MDDRHQRVTALMQLAETLPKHPGMMLLLGHLTAHVDRLIFTDPRNLPDDAEVSVHLISPQAPIWTGRWFQARIDQQNVTDPGMALAKLAERDATDIWLAVDFGTLVPEWYRRVRQTDATLHSSPEMRLQHLRQQVDRTLDIYNECRQALEDGDPERQEELKFLLETARHEVENLSQAIQQFQSRLATRR